MLKVGDKVRVNTLNYEHNAVVTHHGGFVGMDGRHWVKVAVTTPGNPNAWNVHLELHTLDLVE